MESLDSLLCAEGSESLKSLCLKLLLCLVTVSDPYMFVKGINYSRVKPSWVLPPKGKREILYWDIISFPFVWTYRGKLVVWNYAFWALTFEQLLTFLTCRLYDIILSLYFLFYLNILKLIFSSYESLPHRKSHVSQKTDFQSWVSPSTIWVQGGAHVIRLGGKGLNLLSHLPSWSLSFWQGYSKRTTIFWIVWLFIFIGSHLKMVLGILNLGIFLFALCFDISVT